MALVKFVRTTGSSLPSLTKKEGQLIFTTDTKRLYFDNNSSTRLEIASYNVAQDSVDGHKLVITYPDGTTSEITIPDNNTTYTFEQDASDGHIITITPSNGGTATTLTIPDNNTTYTAGTGITISNSNEIANSGVRSVSTGTTNGTISVNTNGTAAEVAVAGLGSLAYKSSLTASEVGAIDSTLIGANNGVAELDSTGKVPSSQLPSYVDDVLEYPTEGDFPATGETGKIYVDTTTNKTYRWGGSSYVVISETLALGETSSTAYRGDHGKTAYDHATDSSRLTTATASGLYKVAATAEGHIASLTAVSKSDITGLGIPGEDTNTTYTLAQDQTDGHKIIFTPSSGSATEITIPDNNTTYTFGTGSTNGTISVTPLGGSASDISVAGLSNAAYKDVDTSISTGSTSAKLPTSQAVAGFVEGKGYTATSFTQGLTSGAEVGTITINGTDTKLYAPQPGNISTELVSPRQTYYLTGVQETTASSGSQVYNTRLSDSFTGVKYVTSTTNAGGTLTVDDREVTLGLYYTIA